MIEKTKNILCRLLPNSAFARSVGVLVGGTAGGQLLLLLAAPLLTRLYSPEDFGLLAVYASLLALISVISTLRYELAIPLPEDNHEAANVMVLCLILLLVNSLLTAVLVIFLGEPVAAMLNVPELADYFWLLPFGVLTSGVYILFNYWGIRTKRFGGIAATKLKQAIATLAVQLTAFKLGGVALLFGQVAGQGVGTTSLALPVLKNAELKGTSWSGICYAIKRYKRFPIFATWAGLLNTGGTQLPPIMIAVFFNATGVGLYALAHRVLTMPVALLGDALQNVFFSDAAEAHRNNQLGEKVKKLLDILMQIAMPPAFILAFTAPWLFAVLFGEPWREAGVFAQWMIPWLVMQFCVGPLTLVNVVTENQRLALIMQAQLFIVRTVMIVIGASYDDLMLTIALFSLGSTFSYLIFLLFILKIVGLSIAPFLSSLTRAALFSSMIVMPIGLLQNSFKEEVTSFIVILVVTLLLVAARYFMIFRSRL